MVNYNGEIISNNDLKLTYQNRAFKYGDAVFDTLKFENKRILFIEDHYFRLMSSMRMLRIKIPMNFTLNYYEDEILKTLKKNNLLENARIRCTVYREDGGLFTPKSNSCNFIIEAEELQNVIYNEYEIELYKDFPVFSGLLSTIKTNNRIVNVQASIFANENSYQNCILINENKNLVEASNANVFLIKENKIFTPALTEGCINGVIRKKIIEMLDKSSIFQIEESIISPFELIKVDEVFLTNSIFEIQSVLKYRKKTYDTDKTDIIRKLFDKFKIEKINSN